MITLRSKTRVVKIKRQSFSECFADMQVGDTIEFSLPIERLDTYKGTSIHKTTKVICHNCRTDKEALLGVNRLVQVLDCCVLKEINP